MLLIDKIATKKETCSESINSYWYDLLTSEREIPASQEVFRFLYITGQPGGIP